MLRHPLLRALAGLLLFLSLGLGLGGLWKDELGVGCLSRCAYAMQRCFVVFWLGKIKDELWFTLATWCLGLECP